MRGNLKWPMAAVLWAVLLLPAVAHAGGTVKGTVTPVEWAQEVEVCVVEPQPSESCTTAAADGSYVLRQVPFGGARIEFVPSNRSRLLLQYYNHKSHLSEASTVFLTSVVPEIGGIDADLLEGGAIEGTVAAAVSGLPLAEVEVCAIQVSSTVKQCEESDESGAYELHSLPTGSYKVSYRGQGRSAEYQQQYYEQEPDQGQADSVAVVAGEVTAGIDAALERGGRIEGRVADAAGEPLPGIAVCLFKAAAVTADRCASADEAGFYAFEGLSSGSYQIGFSLDPGSVGSEAGLESDGFESQYFDRVGNRDEAATISIVAPAVVAGVNGILSAPVVPPPPPSPPPVANPIVAAPPVVPEPKPKPKRCKKGFRKKKVKGKVRCVKVVHRHRRHKHPSHNRKGKQG